MLFTAPIPEASLDPCEEARWVPVSSRRRRRTSDRPDRRRCVRSWRAACDWAAAGRSGAHAALIRGTKPACKTIDCHLICSASKRAQRTTKRLPHREGSGISKRPMNELSRFSRHAGSNRKQMDRSDHAPHPPQSWCAEGSVRPSADHRGRRSPCRYKCTKWQGNGHVDRRSWKIFAQ